MITLSFKVVAISFIDFFFHNSTFIRRPFVCMKNKEEDEDENKKKNNF